MQGENEIPVFPDHIERDLVPMSRLEEFESEIEELNELEFLELQHQWERLMIQRDWLINGSQDHS